MKNNKGFSLVEMLISVAILAIIMVEIFTMMSNSSTLFRNGSYEVELQAEAQRVISQLEDLMIDCNNTISKNYVAMVSSDQIIVSNNDIQYVVTLVKTPGEEYGNLYLSTYEMPSNTLLSADIPMAEYVESISLNMAEFSETDTVTLSVCMRNNMYSYETHKDVYNRNNLGTSSGGAGYGSSTASGNYVLDVLRFTSYNLSSMFDVEGSVYSYAFEDGRTNNGDYEITGSPGNCTLWPLLAVNNSTNACGPYTIIGTKVSGDGPSTVEVKISTSEIRVGAGSSGTRSGYAVVNIPFDAHYTYTTYLDVAGLSLMNARTIEYTFVVHYPDGTSEDFFASTINNPSTGGRIDGSYNFNYTSGSTIDGDDLYMQMDSGITLYCDPISNSLVVETHRLSSGSNGERNYFTFLEDGGYLEIKARISFRSGTPVIASGYLYPSSSGTVMTEAQQDAFFSNFMSVTP